MHIQRIHIIQKLIIVPLITLFMQSSYASDCSDQFKGKKELTVSTKRKFSKQIFLKEILDITKQMKLTLNKTINDLIERAKSDSTLIFLPQKAQKIDDIIAVLKKEMIDLKIHSEQLSANMYEAIDIELTSSTQDPAYTALLEESSYDLSNILDSDLIDTIDRLIDGSKDLEKFTIKVQGMYNNDALNTLATELDQEIKHLLDTRMNNTIETDTQSTPTNTFDTQTIQKEFSEFETLDDIRFTIRKRQEAIVLAHSNLEDLKNHLSQIIRDHIFKSFTPTKPINEGTVSNLKQFSETEKIKKETVSHSHTIQQIDNIFQLLQNEHSRLQQWLEIFTNSMYKTIAADLEVTIDNATSARIKRLEEVKDYILHIMYHIDDNLVYELEPFEDKIKHLKDSYDESHDDLNNFVKELNQEIEESLHILKEEKKAQSNIINKEDKAIPKKTQPSNRPNTELKLITNSANTAKKEVTGRLFSTGTIIPFPQKKKDSDNIIPFPTP